MLKRIALTVTFMAVTTFTIARPVAAHTGGTKAAKVEVKGKAQGFCFPRGGSSC